MMLSLERSNVIAGGTQEPSAGKAISSMHMPQRLDLPLLSLVTVAVTVGMFVFGLLGSGGNLAPPLDDTFIHLQYARQLVAGHPFQYNTGDVPSSGESSFIYPFLLAPAFLLGMDGTTPILYALALGLVGHLATVLLLYKLALLLFNRPTALFAAIFMLLDGRANWHFLSGMETGIYAAALVAFFYAGSIGANLNRFALIGVTGGFVALLRPEGHVVVSVVCLVGLAFLWRSRGFAIAHMWLFLPMVLGLGPYLVNIVLTGHWQFNTAMGKATFFTPYLPIFQQLWLVPAHFIGWVRDSLLGLDVPYSQFPILILLPFLALGIRRALADRSQRLLRLLPVLGLTVGIGLALLPRGSHFDRYFVPYDPLIWLFFTAGLTWLIEQVTMFRGRGDMETSSTPPYAWVMCVIVLALLPQFVRYFFLLGESNRDIYYQQVTFSNWVRDNTPEDARIAVNDVGAHKYLGNRYIIDLLGLTENRMRGVFFSGWGSIYDELVRWPKEERPDYVLVHPGAFINDTDISVAQALLTPIYSISLTSITITAGATETLYRVNWDRASLDPSHTYLLNQGETALDTINIGALRDEEAHSYRTEGKQSSVTEPKTYLTTSLNSGNSEALTDSARRHSGWEEFTVRSVARQSLTLVARTILADNADQRLRVIVDGRDVGIWEARNSLGGAWQEYEYTIPAEYITGEHTRIRIDAGFDPGGPGFVSYRYWVFAP